MILLPAPIPVRLSDGSVRSISPAMMTGAAAGVFRIRSFLKSVVVPPKIFGW